MCLCNPLTSSSIDQWGHLYRPLAGFKAYDWKKVTGIYPSLPSQHVNSNYSHIYWLLCPLAFNFYSLWGHRHTGSICHRLKELSLSDFCIFYELQNRAQNQSLFSKTELLSWSLSKGKQQEFRHKLKLEHEQVSFITIGVQHYGERSYLFEI